VKKESTAVTANSHKKEKSSLAAARTQIDTRVHTFSAHSFPIAISNRNGKPPLLFLNFQMMRTNNEPATPAGQPGPLCCPKQPWKNLIVEPLLAYPTGF
jgi:hypothetical protein